MMAETPLRPSLRKGVALASFFIAAVSVSEVPTACMKAIGRFESD
jgi:hypothetical protein